MYYTAVSCSDEAEDTAAASSVLATASSFTSDPSVAPLDGECGVDTDVLGDERLLDSSCGSTAKADGLWLRELGRLRLSPQFTTAVQSCVYASFTTIIILFLFRLLSSPARVTPSLASLYGLPRATVPTVLPSCSILNPNLTDNLLHHAATVQTDNVHADCGDFYFTGTCVTDDSTRRAFMPRWLVFTIESGPTSHGAGGLADRLKGLLSVLPLALLTGRAFAVHVIDYLPFSEVYGRSELEWVEWEGIPEQVRLGGRISTLEWLNRHKEHVAAHGNVDWRWDWRHYEIVKVQLNLNVFADFAENTRTLPAYRAFGFHAATEKGDLDMYWECLTDYALTFQPPVARTLNELLAQVGRPPVLTWEERMAAPAFAAASTAVSVYLPWMRGGTERRVEQTQLQEGWRPLYCAQLRMGSASARRSTDNTSVGFEDTESFLALSSFGSIFAQLDALIEQHQHITLPSPVPYTLFITSDSNDYQHALPAAWASVPQLNVPGPTAHIDKLHGVADQHDVVLAAYVKSIATHYLLGECDIVAVSATGYGPTARWRTRNRNLHGRPFSARAYDGTYMISVPNATFTPYRHRRGSGGREMLEEYFSLRPPLRKIVAEQLITDPVVQEALNASRYDTFQASSELPFEPPVDPMCSNRLRQHSSHQQVD